MDNSNSNNPSDPNSTNPFINPNPVPTTPVTGDSINQAPLTNPSPDSIFTNPGATPTPPTPTFPSMPSTNPVPTNPSTFLDNTSLPTNPAPISIDASPINSQLPPNDIALPVSETNQNQPTPSDPTQLFNPPADQTINQSIPPQTPNFEPTNIPASNPNTNTNDFGSSMNNPTIPVATNPADMPTNQPSLNLPINNYPDTANILQSAQTPFPPQTAPTDFNLGGLGSTNTPLTMNPQPTVPDLGTSNIPATPTPPATEQPSLVSPAIPSGTSPLTDSSSVLNNYNPAIPTEPETATESAPTDLSHLIDPSMNINGNSQVYAPTLTQQPETLVVPGTGNDVSAAATSSTNSSHIPKWVVGLGIGLLIIVATASAYFILRVGQQAPAPEPASLPAQQTQLQAPPPQIPDTVVPPTNPANDSFGQLNDSTSSASPSATPPRSAADLLRQGQQPSQ